MADPTLLRSFQFKIQLKASAPGGHNSAATPADIAAGTALGDGAFQECTGLEINLDVQEYYEGGRNASVVRRVGRAKYSNVVLRRGMFYGDSGSVNTDLWLWLQGVANGERPVTRYDGTIFVMSVGETVAATWTFDRGLPAKIRGPELNAKTGEVAIEELTIAHEGLRLVTS
jgi:phage tail-like protein